MAALRDLELAARHALRQRRNALARAELRRACDRAAALRRRAEAERALATLGVGPGRPSSAEESTPPEIGPEPPPAAEDPGRPLEAEARPAPTPRLPYRDD